MKLKKMLAAVSSIMLLSTVPFVNAAASESDDPFTPSIVYKGNEVVSDENNIMTFSDGYSILTSDRRDFKITMIAADGAEITNETLGIDSTIAIARTTDPDKANYYFIYPSTEESLDELFDIITQRVSEGLLENAYSQMTFDFQCYGVDENGNIITCAVGHFPATQTTYVNYTPEPEFDGKGDANGDGKLNVRDAAFIARALSLGEGDTLPENADYNEDGVVNVRDAAAIARDLAKK
ncbi:dockerin type I repeat-containing protein [Porcipelethomonas sp.]|uniref:dockerin type I repeat-containing protein n=1 Tax=Porcipelethomonas sp. TaxID=2981675 RepID=UPI003EF9B4D5